MVRAWRKGIAALALLAAIGGAWAPAAFAQYGTDAVINRGLVTVSGTYNSSATSITLQTGDGANLPSVGSFNLAWYDSTNYPAAIDDPNYEIVRCSRSTDVLTCTRGAESASGGGAASNKNTGGAVYKMLATVTAAMIDSIGAQLLAVAPTAAPSFAGLTVSSTATPGLTFIGDGGSAALFHQAYGSSSVPIYRYRRARGTVAAPRRVQTSDTLGNIQFWGAEAVDDSTAATFGATSAVIRAVPLESFTSTAHGSKIDFLTTAIGAATTSVVQLSIASSGVTLGNDTPLNAGANTTFSANLADAFKLTQNGVGDAAITNGMGPAATSEQGQKIDLFHAGRTIRMAPSSRGNTWWQIGNQNNANPAFGFERSQIAETMGIAPDTVTNYYNGVWRVAGNDGTNFTTPYEWGVEGQWTFAGGDTMSRWYLWDFNANAGAGGNLLYHDDFNPTKLHVGDGATQVDLMIENGSLDLKTFAASSTPAAPPSGQVTVFGRSVAGRAMVASVGPSGLSTSYQPFLGRNAVAFWQAPGNATTVPTAVGAAALTATGTATAANVATTNIHTQIRRIEYLVTVAATTAVAGWRSAANMWSVGGTATGVGGFHLVTRFGPATGVTTTTHRLFVGMQSNTSAPTDVEPSTLVNMAGLAYDAADTNMQIMHNDGTGTATKIDLGASFPVPSADRTKAYELALFSKPGTTQEIVYEVTDLGTGAVATGTISTNLPTTSTYLSPRGWMSVGGTSSVIGIAFISQYLESDR